MAYPHKWSPISYKSSAGQRKHTGQRPMLYRWTTPPTVVCCMVSQCLVHQQHQTQLIHPPPHFNDHFPGEPRLVRCPQFSSSTSYGTESLGISGTDSLWTPCLPVTQPTVSKHCRYWNHWKAYTVFTQKPVLYIVTRSKIHNQLCCCTAELSPMTPMLTQETRQDDVAVVKASQHKYKN